MANHKSAKKRARQSERQKLRNREIKGRVRTVVKGFRQALTAGDPEAAQAQLRAAEREIRKAVVKGTIPRRRADRSVSRLAKSLHRAQTQ